MFFHIDPKVVLPQERERRELEVLRGGGAVWRCGKEVRAKAGWVLRWAFAMAFVACISLTAYEIFFDANSTKETLRNTHFDTGHHSRLLNTPSQQTTGSVLYWSYPQNGVPYLTTQPAFLSPTKIAEMNIGAEDETKHGGSPGETEFVSMAVLSDTQRMVFFTTVNARSRIFEMKLYSFMDVPIVVAHSNPSVSDHFSRSTLHDLQGISTVCSENGSGRCNVFFSFADGSIRALGVILNGATIEFVAMIAEEHPFSTCAKTAEVLLTDGQTPAIFHDRTAEEFLLKTIPHDVAVNRVENTLQLRRASVESNVYQFDQAFPIWTVAATSDGRSLYVLSKTAPSALFRVEMTEATRFAGVATSPSEVLPILGCGRVVVSNEKRVATTVYQGSHSPSILITRSSLGLRSPIGQIHGDTLCINQVE